jgi:hypothetical protein
MAKNNGFDDLPRIVISSILMKEPNESIPIYSGIFELSISGKSLTISGSLNLEWFPTKRVRFEGKIIECTIELDELLKLDLTYDIIIDGLKVGTSRFSEITLGDESECKGELNHNVIIGDRSVAVSKIQFAVPNLRDFFGHPVALNTNSMGMNRLTLDTNEYSIIIDKLSNFPELHKKIKSHGGYIFLYSGEITKKNGPIYHDEFKQLAYCLSSFLSFLNGFQCSVYVAQGIYENEAIWTDYSPNTVGLYKTTFSWPCKLSIDGLNEAWQEFYKLWKEPDEEGFINSAVHWYLEANSNSIIENGIILTQIGLELVYNWLIVENKKILIGQDAESISGANKIRLLLSQIGLTNEIPDLLKDLKLHIDQNNLPDGVEAFVQIRNALVHSREEKRRKIDQIDPHIIHQAYQLGLWYLELSILRIIEYRGKYRFRCSDKKWSGEDEIQVPWSDN